MRRPANRRGDVVRAFNERGACLAGAVLTDDLRTGVVTLPTGAWFDPVPDDQTPTRLCARTATRTC
jgi:biotin/methionine sulfoxide reductase